jgi:hypothetical protein
VVFRSALFVLVTKCVPQTNKLIFFDRNGIRWIVDQFPSLAIAFQQTKVHLIFKMLLTAFLSPFLQWDEGVNTDPPQLQIPKPKHSVEHPICIHRSCQVAGAIAPDAQPDCSHGSPFGLHPMLVFEWFTLSFHR